MLKRIVLVTAAFATGAAAQSPAQQGKERGASMVVVNGRVWTADTSQPWAEALAVKGERIVLVGSRADAVRAAGSGAHVIDAHGGMVVPGFIDSHVHFMSGGFQLSSVDLRDARTPAEFVARIKRFAATAPRGAWITGGDWDHHLWGGTLPTREWIDSVTPNNPVSIARLDGHMILANSAALAAAKITSATPDVAGGAIVRDASGSPTGILKDNAQDIVFNAMPDPPPEVNDRALDAAMHYVASQGVTSVAHMGTWDDLAVFERAHKAGRMITRISAAVPMATWERLRDTVAARGRGDEWLAIGGVKAFVDGSLGSHTAAFMQPFTDVPTDTGLYVTPPDSLYARISGADRAGLHVMVHAIGDRANHVLLDIFERVERENGAKDRRFRIEHAQHLLPADIPRFAKLGVIASMQPYHAIDDGRWAESVIGPERIKTTYAFRSLRDAGVRLAFGSDWDVAPPIPLIGIYAAVTRRTLDDKNPNGWVPEQKIGVEDALRAYTINGAYAMFDEKNRGSLEAGKLADFAIIDRDLTKIPPTTLRDAKIVLTVAGGKVVYDAAHPSR